jgi:intraflagellar transport protein 172
MSPHLLSLRYFDSKIGKDPIRKIAYLVDLQTINILDIMTNTVVATINHDNKLDWLELSTKGDMLLYRDTKKQLHLYTVQTQKRVTLLSFCSYVQWVPDSDVVVAQSKSDLCIWYSINSPDRVTTFPIKGEIQTIERIDGKTDVVVDEGVNTVTYTLDEGLIEFGAALENHDYDRGIRLLENLDMSPETITMWKTLSDLALKDRKLIIAERCAAAMGDISRTRYLHGLNEILQDELDFGVSIFLFLIKD